MSTQGAKKKRIGSRRRVTNQNKTSEDDDFLVKDGTTVAQYSVAAENTEAEDAVTNPDHLLSQTHDPLELSRDRRKLGSSRRHKGDKHVKATELHHKPKEEVEQKTEGNESPERDKVSGARESWKQETLSQATKYEMSRVHEGLLSVSGEELFNPHSVTENPESDDKEANSEVLTQDGNFQGNYVMCATNADLGATQFSTLPERSTDESSHTEKTGVEFCTGETCLLPHEEQTIREEQTMIFSLSEDSQRSDEVVNEVTEKEQTQQFKSDDNSDTLVGEGQAPEIISGNPMNQDGVSSTEFIAKLTNNADESLKMEDFICHEKQDEQYQKANVNISDNNIENHHDNNTRKPQTSDADTADPELGQVDEIGGRVYDNEQTFSQKPEITFAHENMSESSVQMLPGIYTSFDSKLHDDYATKAEHSTDINLFENRRKLGSSRRRKVKQQVQDLDAESNNKTMLESEENIMDNEFISEMVSVPIETAGQENLMESGLGEKVDSGTHETEESGSRLKESLRVLSLADENSPEDESETESGKERATFASLTGESFPTEGQRELYTIPEVEHTHQSEDAENTGYGREPVQVQDMLEAIPSTESVVYDAAEYSEIVSAHQINQGASETCYQSDLNGKTVDSATNSNADNTLEEHPPKDNMEAFDNGNKDYSDKPQISDRVGIDTALDQSQGKEEVDTKLISKPARHLERTEVHIETEESNSQTLQLQTHVPVNTQPLETKDSLDPFAAEFDQKPAEEDVKEIEENKLHKTSVTDETAVVDKSEVTALEDVNPFDISHFEEKNDGVTNEADGGTPVDISEISSLTTNQNLTDKSSLEEQVIRLSTFDMASNEEHKSTEEATSEGDEIEQTQIQEISISPEGVADNVTESFTIISENLTDQISDSCEPESIEQSVDFAAMQDNPHPGDNQVREGFLFEESDVTVPFDSKPPDVSESNEEPSHTGFNGIKNRRKMGSSRRHKDRYQVKDSVPDLYPVHKVDKELETSQTERESQEELCQGGGDEFGITTPVTHDSMMCSTLGQSGAERPPISSHTDIDEQSFVIVGESMTLDGLESNDSQKEDLQGALHSDEALNKVQNKDAMPEQMQDMPGLDNYSKSVKYDATEYSVKSSEDLIAEGQENDIQHSELTAKCTDDSLNTQVGVHPHDKHPTEDMGIQDFDQMSEDLHVYGSKTAQQINNTEIENTPLSQHKGFSKKEGAFVGAEQDDSSSQTLQSHFATNPQDQKTGGKENKDLPAELFHGDTEEYFKEGRENEPHNTTKISIKEEKAFQEIVVEAIVGVTTTNDSAWSEDNEGEGNSFDSTLVEELTVLCSNSTLDQQEHEQLLSMEMQGEERPLVASRNESGKGEMEKELFRLDGKLYDNFVVSESALTEGLPPATYQPGENTQNESSVEQAEFSPSQGKLSTNEDKKEHRYSEVGAAWHLENTTIEVHKEPTQMQEVHEVIHSAAVEESESGANVVQSEINSVLDFEHQLIETSRNQLGNRRKLGSSRRNKRHVKDTVTETSDESKEELVEKNSNNEEKEEKSEEHTDEHLKSPIELEYDKENPGTILSHNLMDSLAIKAVAITSNLGQDDSVKSLQDVTEEQNMEAGNLSRHMGNDTVRFDMMQSTAWKDDSEMQNTPCHDDIVSARSFSSDPLEQEDDYRDQKREAISCDEDKEIYVAQTDDAVDTVGDATVNDSFTVGDTSINALDTEKDEAEEKLKDPMKKCHIDQDSMAAQDIKSSELSSTTCDRADLPVSSDTGLAVVIRTGPSVDVGEQSGISTIVSEIDSQNETQRLSVLHESENLQEKFKQRKRKFGSNRRTPRKAVQEEAPENKDEASERDSQIEAEVKKSEKIEIIESPRPVNVEVSQDDKEGSSTSDLQKTESNPMQHKNTLLSLNEEYENKGESSVSFDETPQSSQNDETSESINAIQNQASEPAEEQVVADLETMSSVISGAEEKEKKVQVNLQVLSTKDEGDQDMDIEVKNLGLILSSTSQRRKMGSTRKSLKPKIKEGDVTQKNEVHIEAQEFTTNVEDVKIDVLTGIKEEEPQLHGAKEDSESEPKKSLLVPSAHPSSEGNSVSNNQVQEEAPYLTPSYSLTTTQSTSAGHNVTSESASGGRRRKMGSHRKSHGPKNIESQTAGEVKMKDTENEDESGSFTGQTEVKTTEEESLDRQDISEVEETNKRASPDPSSTEAGEDTKPVSEKISIQVTPAQHPNAKFLLNEERQEIPLAITPTEATGGSKSHNVVMVGDSGVGKTSFMKRAQSGKFSPDVCSTIGVDYCLWTVLVDGKPVLLQLWDTAGAERFHSVTKQFFHKAQAFLLMYDVTNAHSFSAVSYWASCIQDAAAEDVTVLLLGNKNDHPERCVTTQEGETLAKEHGFEFMECSAATGENVIHSLETLARMLRQKVDTRKEATVLSKEPQKKKSGCC